MDIKAIAKKHREAWHHYEYVTAMEAIEAACREVRAATLEEDYGAVWAKYNAIDKTHPEFDGLCAALRALKEPTR